MKARRKFNSAKIAQQCIVKVFTPPALLIKSFISDTGPDNTSYSIRRYKKYVKNCILAYKIYKLLPMPS